jgi:hypothetical protein
MATYLNCRRSSKRYTVFDLWQDGNYNLYVFLHNKSMRSCCARTLARPPMGSVLLVHGGQGGSLVPLCMPVASLSLSLLAWWWWWFGGKGLLVHLYGRGRHCVRDGTERGGAHHIRCLLCVALFGVFTLHLGLLVVGPLGGRRDGGPQGLVRVPFPALNSSAFGIFRWDTLSWQGTKRLTLR